MKLFILRDIDSGKFLLVKACDDVAEATRLAKNYKPGAYEYHSSIALPEENGVFAVLTVSHPSRIYKEKHELALYHP